jgi:hypothetical protein
VNREKGQVTERVPPSLELHDYIYEGGVRKRKEKEKREIYIYVSRDDNNRYIIRYSYDITKNRTKMFSRVRPSHTLSCRYRESKMFWQDM